MPEPVRILIALEGGVIQDIKSNGPVDVIIEDFDDEARNSSRGRLTPIGEHCTVSKWNVKGDEKLPNDFFPETVDDRFRWWADHS